MSEGRILCGLGYINVTWLGDINVAGMADINVAGREILMLLYFGGRITFG